MIDFFIFLFGSMKFLLCFWMFLMFPVGWLLLVTWAFLLGWMYCEGCILFFLGVGFICGICSFLAVGFGFRVCIADGLSGPQPHWIC